MKVNYKKVHILLDSNMKKKELLEPAGVSTYTINKFNKNENITLEVLSKACKALDCILDNIIDFEDRKSKELSLLFLSVGMFIMQFLLIDSNFRIGGMM